VYLYERSNESGRSNEIEDQTRGDASEREIEGEWKGVRAVVLTCFVAWVGDLARGDVATGRGNGQTGDGIRMT
jgi:hypothetical protein